MMDYSGGADTDQYCQDCRRVTQTILDHRQGDTICTECGLILEAYFVDTTAEWRTFADSDDDPTRTGEPVNPLLNTALGTFISDPKNNYKLENNNNNNNSQTRSLGRVNHIAQKHVNPDKSLDLAFASIAAKAYTLGIVKCYETRAQEIYKNAYDKKLCRGKKEEATTLACLYIACKDGGNRRNLREISSVSDEKVSKGEINKRVGELRRGLGISDNTVISPQDRTARILSSIGMNNPKERKAVNEILDKCKEEHHIRRTPDTLLAGSVYLLVKLSDKGIGLKEVSAATGVAITTIKKVYKDLCDKEIMPSGFASEDLKKLRTT